MTIHDPRFSDVIIIGGGATGAGVDGSVISRPAGSRWPDDETGGDELPVSFCIARREVCRRMRFVASLARAGAGIH